MNDNPTRPNDDFTDDGAYIGGAALRVLLFRRDVLERRAPWLLRDAAEQLELHERTIRRYLRLLALVEVDDAGRPAIWLEPLPGGMAIMHNRL